MTAADLDLAEGKLVHAQHMAEHGSLITDWDALHPGARATYVRIGRKRRLARR